MRIIIMSWGLSFEIILFIGVATNMDYIFFVYHYLCVCVLIVTPMGPANINQPMHVARVIDIAITMTV